MQQTRIAVAVVALIAAIAVGASLPVSAQGQSYTPITYKPGTAYSFYPDECNYHYTDFTVNYGATHSETATAGTATAELHNATHGQDNVMASVGKMLHLNGITPTSTKPVTIHMQVVYTLNASGSGHAEMGVSFAGGHIVPQWAYTDTVSASSSPKTVTKYFQCTESLSDLFKQNGDGGIIVTCHVYNDQNSSQPGNATAQVSIDGQFVVGFYGDPNATPTPALTPAPTSHPSTHVQSAASSATTSTTGTTTCSAATHRCVKVTCPATPCPAVCGASCTSTATSVHVAKPGCA